MSIEQQRLAAFFESNSGTKEGAKFGLKELADRLLGDSPSEVRAPGILIDSTPSEVLVGTGLLDRPVDAPTPVLSTMKVVNSNLSGIRKTTEDFKFFINQAMGPAPKRPLTFQQQLELARTKGKRRQGKKK